MKITIINNGSTAVHGVGYVNVQPGETKVFENRTNLELDIARSQIASEEVLVIGEREGVDKSPIVCELKDPGNPGAGVADSANEGFDLLTEAGAAANVDPELYMALFDDEACTQLAATATLHTATTGSFVSGEHSNNAVVEPAATGEFDCTITNTGLGTVYIRVWPTQDAQYLVDCHELGDVTFTA